MADEKNGRLEQNDGMKDGTIPEGSTRYRTVK